MIAYVTLFAALSISVVAAWYSLMGLAAIFASAPVAVIIMGSSLEFAKVVTASWLYNNWNKTPILLKSYLTVAVCVLVFITSMGIFGFLSKAHIDQTINVGDNSVVITRLEQQITREETIIADSTKVIAQLDQAVQTLMDYDRVRGKDGAIAVRQSQKEERAELASIIAQSQSVIDDLEEQKLELSKEQIALEAEVGPLKYIAELVYGDEAKDHFDEAVRWVIIIIVFVFDPLAILLLIAANQSLKEMRDEKERLEEEQKKFTVATEQVGDFTELSTDRVQEVDIPEGMDTVSEVTPEDDEPVEISTAEEEMSPTSTIQVDTSYTYPEAIDEVKQIVKEDEDTLWEKFQKRREWKEPNSGIVQHEYVEEKKPKDK
jgi:hypothetical protein